MPAGDQGDAASTTVPPSAFEEHPSVWDQLRQALSPIEARPRVVDRIEVARFTTRAGQPYVVIHNPAAGTYLKLEPREFDLLELMDGTRSVKALVIAYFQRHGVLAAPRLLELVRTLREHRFLDEPPPLDVYAELLQQSRGTDAMAVLKRVARGFLSAQFAWRGVDRYFAAVYRAVGWLAFTRPAIVLGAVLGLLALPLFFLELNRDRYSPFRAGDSYLLGFFVLEGLWLVALAIHEFGHGVAVKHACRTVSRAGVMLYYGLPTAWVDTTDVWMASPRQRLLVSFAGPWTGLVLGGVALLGAYLLPTGPLGALGFTAGFLFLFNNLLNFNPLLELDGYYMLVDLLEKPMLRPRAFAFVRGQLWGKLRRHEPLSSEERLFAIFGVAALVWSGVEIGLVLRLWERRLAPVIQETWTSGGVLGRIGLAVICLLVATPLVLGGWQSAQHLGRWLARLASRLHERVGVRRYRAALAALRAVPVWADQSEGLLLAVSRAMRAENVTPGDEVVRQGESGDRFYVIDDGEFEVLMDARPVAHLARGDYFGERALLYDVPRRATVMATRSGRVFWIDRATFDALLAHDLKTRARLEENLAFRADVAAIPLFRDLSPTELDVLLVRLVPLDIPPNEVITCQGELSDRFYILRSGAVEVIRDGQRVEVLCAGAVFGEIALLRRVPRTATTRAVTSTTLLALNASDFDEILLNYCGRASELEQLSSLRLPMHKRLVGG